MNIIIYIRNDALLIFRRNIYAEMHQHHGIQITVALRNDFEAVLDQQQTRHQLLVIESDYPHRVVGQDEWVATLLINPETAFAKAIQSQVLLDKPYRSVAMSKPPKLELPNEEQTCSIVDTVLSGARHILIPSYSDEFVPDARIKKALEIVQQQFGYKISAKELSRQIYLSESRLGHLFKEVVGIPLRRYLLWSRLLLAARLIARGERFTFAAHETGFTDSAHLSRTFFRMFGLRISDMFKDRDAVRVIFCDDPPDVDSVQR